MVNKKFLSAFLARISATVRAPQAMNVATRVMDNPFSGKQLLQLALDEKALLLEHVKNPDTGFDEIFLTKPGEKKGILRECRIALPDAGLSANEAVTLNYLNQQWFQIHRPTFDFLVKFRDNFKELDVDGRTIDKASYVIKNVETFLVQHPDGMFRQDHRMPDQRRIYATHNPLSHQGNDIQRGIVDFGKSYSLNRKHRKAFEAITQDEYGVNFKNWRKILEKPELLFTDPKALGVKGKKPICTYRCAYAYSELHWTGSTSYIVQQDQTCSGFQHASIEFGCDVLATATNLKGGDKQDLYSLTAGIAKNSIALGSDGRYAYFLTRSGGKFFVLRLGYGAASKSLARGLILADPQTDPLVYLTEDGTYIPGVLDKLEFKRFNQDNYAHWLSIGNWEGCCEIASITSKAYYDALMTISPKLQSALRMIKQANKAAIEGNEFLTWILPNGDIKQNIGWAVDPEAKPVKIQLTANERKCQFIYLPMRRLATDSSAAPKFIHSLDGFICGEIIRECFMADIPIATIHDSMGSSVEHFLQVKEMWKKAVYAHLCARERSLFMQMMKDYEIPIPATVWRNGWHSIDIGAAEHYMG